MPLHSDLRLIAFATPSIRTTKTEIVFYVEKGDELLEVERLRSRRTSIDGLLVLPEHLKIASDAVVSPVLLIDPIENLAPQRGGEWQSRRFRETGSDHHYSKKLIGHLARPGVVA
jgi:hypothetical protein